MVNLMRLFCFKGDKARRRPKRAEYQDEKVEPRLPAIRPRALTLYHPGKNALGPLLSLPFVLRHEIYQAVLGHQTVHVAFEFGPREYRTGNRKEHKEWRWWHCICTRHLIENEEDADYRELRWDPCRRCTIERRPGPPNGMMGKLKLEFSLLLTCRQVYSEAIDILYNSTTFNFASRQLLCKFPSLVLPQRFARITSIEMLWVFVNLGCEVIPEADKQAYYDQWAMLAAMPELRRIRIAVGAYECPHKPQEDLQEVWLGPVEQMGKRDFLEVQVPFSYAQHFKVGEGENFTLTTFEDRHTAGSHVAGTSDLCTNSRAL